MIIQKSLRVLKILRPLLHSRWEWLFSKSFFRLHGGFVIVMGVYLALPLPIPFSNLLAAWSLLLMGLGLIEDDGLVICLSYAIGGIGLLIVGFLIFWLHAWAVS